MNHIRTSIFTLVLLAQIAGTASAMTILKIQSLKSGDIILNGKHVDLNAFKAALSQAKKSGDAVWYYRDAATGEPTEAQFAAFKALVDAQLPISLSTKPDFSDYVGPDGQSHPRK